MRKAVNMQDGEQQRSDMSKRVAMVNRQD